MRKLFKTQNAAVTAAFFIAPVLPGHGFSLLLYGAVGAATGLAFWTVVMLGPEPNQSAAKNWVEPFRQRR
jgi:hypothetical protein